MAITPPGIEDEELEIATPQQPGDLTEPAPRPEEESVEPEYSIIRPAITVAFPLLSAGIVVGAIFIGAGARVQAGVAALLGIVVAVVGRRIRRLLFMNLVVIAGLFAIGLLMMLPSGVDNVLNLTSNVVGAAASGDVLRPPVDYVPGWRAILGWLMAGLGFATAWTAIEARTPARAMLIPLILVGIGSISVPKDQQLATGIAAVVLFLIGLGLLSGVERQDERIPLSYELRRFARGVPLIGVVVVALVILARANLLFPPPLYDPTQEAQKPKAVPLAEVPDRVLFTVSSNISGPWRMGVLDVYDGRDWRLPPFAQSRLERVPASGIIDRRLTPGFRAEFEVKGLTGTVLPGLPNTVGLLARDLELQYDHRTGNLRAAQGQVSPGITYTVSAARLPAVDELQRISGRPPQSIERFLDIPTPPAAVVDLLRQAPTTSDWDRLDFLRQRFLQTVVASGAGSPVSVPPDRVEDMLAGSKQGTPFEIVAAQAMLARWAGVPSRIGYGFDGGDPAGPDTYEVRPKHGATFLEVYFAGHGWLPVIGSPKQAKTNLTESVQQTSPNIIPSNEIAVDLIIPLLREPPSTLLQQIRQTVLLFVGLVGLVAAIYYLYPSLAKARQLSRRRRLALSQGPSARISVAYAEWRDLTTDLGYRHPADTPLMFLDRVMDDDEHIALAWLVTRTLWGDLAAEISDDDAELAEQLSTSLRKRAAQAHPYTLRVIAALSRLSLRYPYAPQAPRAQRRKLGPAKRQEGARVAS